MFKSFSFLFFCSNFALCLLIYRNNLCKKMKEFEKFLCGVDSSDSGVNQGSLSCNNAQRRRAINLKFPQRAAVNYSSV